MAQLGFSEIVNPMVRNSAGRLMTIPKGASMKGIDMGSQRLNWSLMCQEP